MIHTRYATIADLKSAAPVLQSAARRLVVKGEPLWDPASFTPASLETWLGELCVATLEGGAVVGAMRLQPEDPAFWPEVPHGSSLYVHKLAVSDAARGRGVAQALLEFARSEANARGRAWLRLDCADRPALRAVYERFGFQYRDTREVHDFTVCRYELPV